MRPDGPTDQRRSSLPIGLTIALLLGSLAAAPVRSQTSPLGVEQYDTSYLEPLDEAGRSAATPNLIFRLATEIALPGPLPDSGPRLVEGLVRIPVAGGLAESGWDSGSTARVQSHGGSETSPPDDPSLLWSLSPNAKVRYTLTDDGFLLAQKRCRTCPAGWRKRWRLRVAGAGLAPPLVTEKRIYYGALDNRVYALKRRNGHRVWEADLEGRVSRSLRIWRPAEPEDQAERAARAPSPALLLVVPDDGSAVVALDARTGAKVASYELPDDGGTLVGAPVVTPDGRIVVARQKYTPEDASLMVFRLVSPRQPA